MVFGGVNLVEQLQFQDSSIKVLFIRVPSNYTIVIIIERFFLVRTYLKLQKRVNLIFFLTQKKTISIVILCKKGINRLINTNWIGAYSKYDI